jgi:thiosulfate dehydrogenase
MIKMPCLSVIVPVILIAAVIAISIPLRGATDAPRVDLSAWTPPDIKTVGDDPFGKLVKRGYALLVDTANQMGPNVADSSKRFTGNNLNCQSCHLQGGTQPYAMPLVGLWGQFPQYRGREGDVILLEDRINGCMERSMNGHPLPRSSQEMTALLAYVRWLSNGVPVGTRPVGGGVLTFKEPARGADVNRGKQLFVQTCAACHESNGLGQRAATGLGYQFPPLRGPDSFNSGAGMAHLLTAAAFIRNNMPFGTTFAAPALSEEDAYDIAGYIVSADRPQAIDLAKDYPNRLQKPVDTSYGPYADGFSSAQHTLGPFGPIRARVKELSLP